MNPIIRENGESNKYHVDCENDWVFAIQFNGKYTVEQQIDFLKKMVKSISRSRE